MQILFGTEMRQKLRILVLASSNAAVDIIGRRLLHIRDKIPSHGKSATISVTILNRSIDRVYNTIVPYI